MRHFENAPIQQFLASRSLTEAEVAKRAWCSQRTVQRWAREGKQPRAPTLRLFAAALNTTEVEIKELTVRQRCFASGCELNVAFLNALQACDMAARLPDPELERAGIDVSRMRNLLETLPALSDRLARLTQPSEKRRRIFRPPPRPSGGVTVQPNQ